MLANREDLAHLARFNGPQLNSLSPEKYPLGQEVRLLHQLPEPTLRGAWLVVPEVTHITYHPSPPTLDAILYAKHYGLKSAFIFYDAIPLKLDEYRATAEAHGTYMQHLALADLVLPISNFSAHDYVSYLKSFLYFQDRTLPVVRSVLLPGEDPSCPRPARVERDAEEILILSVGTLEPRKNQLTLIDAFNEVCAKHPQLALRLVLVGNLHQDVADSIRLAIRDNWRIKYVNYLEDQEVANLYRQCTFTVYPSVEEGFGLPILESLWHGKPCICADFGAMREIGQGGGCLLVDVRSHEEIGAALERLVTDEKQWQDVSQQALDRKIATWDDYASEISSVLHEDWYRKSKVGRILYWVDHTSYYPSNSGIQRVVRLLAKLLMGLGIELVPVKWDIEREVFTVPTREDLDHLHRWSGPGVNSWMLCDAVAAADNVWLLIPELTTYPGGPDLERVLGTASRHGIRSAVVFYDAIPLKMHELYPPEATARHANYMSALNMADVVMAISDHGRLDLRQFLLRTQERLIGLDDRVIAINLPGEFIGIPRVTRYQPPLGEVIRILSVGTIEPRKNHITMIKAFLHAVSNRKNKAELTLVGSAPFADLRSEIEKYADLNGTVKWVNHVNDDDLQQLYSACHFTVYPSLDEGFGLPILESLWHGKPCICRDRGAIAEVAQGGGCLLVNTAEQDELAEAIRKLIDDEFERERLGHEATSREFKTWENYAREVLTALEDRSASVRELSPAPRRAEQLYPPLLSICITTYNRAAWLAVSLKQLANIISPYGDVVELVVCDNASSDHTESVVHEYSELGWFRYVRNPVNVGMLGNLRETVHHARGRFVWILGDDDIVKLGALEKILTVIMDYPDISLIYLNYAYTHHSAPRTIQHIGEFIASAIPITPPTEDKCSPVSEIATMSENFFTAIYCLIFRRDHAIKAYSQDIVGRPFSSLLTCIPTAHYVCNHMFGEMGYWIGQPCVVVNMNVSWMKYAPLWRLERIPELHELAETQGAAATEIDHWRVHNLQGASQFLESIYFHDSEGNAEFFSFERFIRRHKHLPEFTSELSKLMSIYGKAYDEGRARSEASPTEMRARFNLGPRSLIEKWRSKLERKT